MLLSVAPRTLGRRRGAAPSSATARRIGLVGTVVPATIAAVAPPVSAARCESATTPPPPAHVREWAGLARSGGLCAC